MRSNLWKDPNTYFVALPILVGLWALGAGLVFYPKSVKSLNTLRGEYAEAENLIDQILTLEPERLNYQEQKGQSAEFDYAGEVDRFAKEYGIAPSDYTLSVRQALKQKGKLRKSADLSINSIKVEVLAGFVSSMLFRWQDLQCEQISIEKVGNARNQWKAKIRFTYYY